MRRSGAALQDDRWITGERFAGQGSTRGAEGKGQKNGLKVSRVAAPFLGADFAMPGDFRRSISGAAEFGMALPMFNTLGQHE